MRPWREVKSRRGRKKQYATEGYACLNPRCQYSGITDEGRHALVRHTARGKDKDIPFLRCQNCKQVFTSRKGTPLYYLKTKPERVEMVLWFLVEGVDVAVMARYTGHKDATIARWLERMGRHSAGLHNVLFRGLILALVQLDELYAKVRDREQAAWLWLAIDPVSKIIPTLHLGGRKSEDAYAVVARFEGTSGPGMCAGVHHGWLVELLLRDHGAFRILVPAQAGADGSLGAARRSASRTVGEAQAGAEIEVCDSAHGVGESESVGRPARGRGLQSDDPDGVH